MSDNPYPPPPPVAYQQQQNAAAPGDENKEKYHQAPPPNASYEYGGQAEQQGYSRQDDQYPPPPPVDYATKPNGNGPTFDDQFKVEKPKINDPIFIFVFLAVIGGFLAVAAITINAYRGNKGFEGNGIYDTSNSFSLNTNTIILFAFVIVVAVVLSLLYYFAARMFTRQFIILTMILNVVFAIGTAIYYLVEKYWSAGIVFLVFGLFTAYCYWTMRSRIPFATLVLQTVIDVTRKHPSTLAVSAIGSLIAAAFAAFFAVVLTTVYVKYDPNPQNPQCANGGCSQAKLVGIIIFITFAGFYISEVIKNVIHVTISGVYGSWYYCSRSTQGMPKWPAFGAFKRAMTYSFGSISFGSLIVAFINLVRYILQMLRNANAQNGNNFFITAILCFAQCLIGILDWAVQYFNNYAYTYIALYGKAYLPAAKDTWQIIKHRGIDALINDSLIGGVLTFGAMFVGYASALLAYFYLRFTKPAYNSSGGYYPIVVSFALLIGIQIGNVTTVSIRSGVTTLFVALAKDPDVLRQSYPQIYEGILRTYPQVRERLNL